MKRVIDWLVLAAIIFTAVITAAKSAHGERMFCIAAEYARISPTEWVGITTCGNMWKVVIPFAVGNADSVFKARGAGHSIGHASGEKAEAWYLDEADGSWNQLEKVPALGDTLGYVDIREK